MKRSQGRYNAQERAGRRVAQPIENLHAEREIDASARLPFACPYDQYSSMRVYPWMHLQRLSLRTIRATAVHPPMSPHRAHGRGSCTRGAKNERIPAATWCAVEPISALLILS
jgi:hypothetical protein